MAPSKAWLKDFSVFLVALIFLASAMVFLHALDSGLSGNDEGSHFLNGYLIWSYVTEALGQNPMTYATEFYIHYPKISIGHWPPLYYLFLGSLFFVLPHNALAFMVVNLIVGALPALLVARMVRPVLGLQWALLAAITYVLIPISINNTVRIMLDQALAGLCLLGALLWSTYVKTRTLRSALAYAVVAAAAILVKGNGWVLAIFPFFHIALTGQWRILINWRTYVAGALALLVVGGWTVVTYKISSDGFNYQWGIDYFVLAMTTFLRALYANLGPIGLIAALAGIAGSLAAKDRPELRELGRTGLALILATLIFHSIVPVDLDSRYMSSAIPPLAIFMAIGVWMGVERWRWASARIGRVVFVAIAVFSIPGILFLHDRPARFDMGMDLMAAELTGQPGGTVIVIDGHPGAEGALAAEVALRDTKRENYVVRSSQLLAKSDFMGKRYALRVETPEGVLGLLNEITTSAVVVTDGPFIQPRFAHSDLLLEALKHPSSPFSLKQTFQHLRHEGRTYLYVRTPALPPLHAAVKRVSFPEKAMQ